MDPEALGMIVITGILFVAFIIWNDYWERKERRRRYRHHMDVCEHMADVFSKGLFYAKVKRMREENDRDLRRSEYLWMKRFRGFMNQLESEEMRSR